MIVYTDNEKYILDLTHLLKSTNPFEKIEVIKKSEDFFNDSKKLNSLLLYKKDNKIIISIIKGEKVIYEDFENKENSETRYIEKLYENSKISENEKNLSLWEIEKSTYKRLMLKTLNSKILKTPAYIPYGILTGIRPVSKVNSLKKQSLDYLQGSKSEKIISILKEKYLMSLEKIQLLMEISKTQESFSDLENGFCVYIHIPFCKSRCSYCSFFSQDINYGYKKNLVSPYLEALNKEIRHTLALPYFKKNKILNSIYIGGGTPSSLMEKDLEFLFKIVNENFLNGDFTLRKNFEYTFEGGRVDTLNGEKLRIIKNNYVNRISINPQTMNNHTLKKINRKHSQEDIVNMFNLARSLGFDNINMDLILGLENETREDFFNSLNKIKKLSPESITIHSLYIKKKAENLKKQEKVFNTDENNGIINRLENGDLKIMDEICQDLKNNSYFPYYLYRQKGILNNMENIGFYKNYKKNISIYNIATMERLCPIIGFGANSTSNINKKLIMNYKDIILYINNFQEMVKRKENSL